MSGHSLKLHFYMFEKSRKKHNSLDCDKKKLEYFPLIKNFTFLKLDTNKKCFCMFKALKLQEWAVLVFSNVLFIIKCAPFLLKFEEDFNIHD